MLSTTFHFYMPFLIEEYSKTLKYFMLVRDFDKNRLI